MARRIPLKSLKLREIQRVASAIGSGVSKTKAQHLGDLPKICSVPLIPRADRAGTRRILSVDMGIRNLAYCVIDVPERALEPSNHLMASSDFIASLQVRVESLKLLDFVELVAWNRFEPAVDSDVEPGLTSVLSEKDPFSPAFFSKLAFGVVNGIFLPFEPSVLVIERQRYRTGGNSNVLEWTIRVNMFECALHATLEALSHRDGATRLFPTVASVDPRRVASFWASKANEEVSLDALEDFSAASTPSDVSAESSIVWKEHTEKDLKIATAASWLPKLKCSTDQSKFISDAFTAEYNLRYARRFRNENVKIPRTPRASQRLPKLDDLADCLVQGMALAQWEANRKYILEHVDFQT